MMNQLCSSETDKYTRLFYLFTVVAQTNSFVIFQVLPQQKQ